MSEPINPLANYRSYSYYHVLTICDSITTAEALASETDLSVWEHIDPNNPANRFTSGKFAPKMVGDSGLYCVLIHGATDADYVITDVKYSTLTAANIYAGDRSNSIALEGSIGISEPKGIMFLDTIVRCCNDMGIDAATAAWALKTFFVGYDIDDKVTIISDIAPLLFAAIDVTGTFSEAGGLYEIQLVGLSHGLSNLPQYSKLPQALNYVTHLTLRDSMKSLEEEINNQATRYLECAKAQIKSISPATSEALTEVIYRIVLHPPYDSDEYKTDYQIPQAKTTPGCDHKASATAASGQSIHEAINYLMGLSTKVREEAANEKNGERYFHKIITGPIEENGKLVHVYNVRRYRDPMTISISDLATDKNIDNKLGDNLIKFNYLYTGKNVDILEYDMKLSLGLAYLMMSTSHNSYNSQTQVGDISLTVSANDITQGIGHRHGDGKVVKQIPVGFGTQIKKSNIGNNTPNISQSTSSSYNLKKASSFEVIDMSMLIVGNTLLLSSVNRNSTPSIVNSADDAPSGEGVFPDWGKVPSVATVTIKMPRNNDDSSLFLGDFKQDTTYAVDFWFDGYYYVIGIEHLFVDGQFTQRLEMLGIPRTNFTEETKSDGTEAKEIDQDKLVSDLNYLVSECFENRAKCKDISGNEVKVIPELRPRIPTKETTLKSIMEQANNGDNLPKVSDPTLEGLTDPTKSNDTQKLLSDAAHKMGESKTLDDMMKNSKLEDFPKWKIAPPELKEAIFKASADIGVDPKTLFVFACAENGQFKANANSGTGAGGMYQFIPSTFKMYSKPGESRYNITHSTYAAARYIKDIHQNSLKKLGIPSDEMTLGDIYAAYQQGEPMYHSLLTSCRNGKENFTEKQWNSVKIQAAPIKYAKTPCDAIKRISEYVNSFLPNSVSHKPNITSGSNESLSPSIENDKVRRKNMSIAEIIHDCVGKAQQEQTKDAENPGCNPEIKKEQDTKLTNDTSAPVPKYVDTTTPKTEQKIIPSRGNPTGTIKYT